MLLHLCIWQTLLSKAAYIAFKLHIFLIHAFHENQTNHGAARKFLNFTVWATRMLFIILIIIIIMYTCRLIFGHHVTYLCFLVSHIMSTNFLTHHILTEKISLLSQNQFHTYSTHKIVVYCYENYTWIPFLILSLDVYLNPQEPARTQIAMATE